MIYILPSLILSLVLSPAQARAAEPLHFISTAEGEIVSDIDHGDGGQLDFSWNTDPFLKVPGYGAMAPDPDPLTLQGTFTQGSEQAAIINDRVVKQGDQVDGRKVRKVGKSFVLLEKGGSIREVGLYDEPEEKAAAPAGAVGAKSASKTAAPRSPASNASEASFDQKIAPMFQPPGEPQIRIDEVLK